ncbi:glycosyltransferase family protein [Kineothrix sp. MB12-C1]|uniref:glycosyltransferase family protein n=1 Tax=Kineothrix sp. MB12-C1 TaxID=3070215 RepID=UPI0027D27A6C|nr:glycosyltransferase [Kineothrix sp. MB12-C1]WMC93880.1 glycosyltransferase [Kineothrix sp. MB12-C1]
MNAVICYTRRLPRGEEKELSFLDILLDDTWVGDNIQYEDSLVAEIGDKNTCLSQKRNYEFVLRAAKRFRVKAIGAGIEGCDDISQEDTWEALKTDCYVLGKYQQELLTSGYFDQAVTILLSRAVQLDCLEKGVKWLEKMIAYEWEYYEIEDNIGPILIYKTNDSVFNLLNLFAEQIAASFIACRQRVEVIDVQKEGNAALTRLIGRRFKAIIGIQTYVFSIMMKDKETNLHDLVVGPKYNLILDHPAWMKEHFSHAPKDYHLLIHDRNYLMFANRFYKHIGRNYHFPLAGVSSGIGRIEKRYDVSFIGTYHDYRERLAIIKGYEREKRFLVARYLHIMKRYPNITAEEAFQRVLDYYGWKLSDTNFLELFYESRQACFCVMSYYREKILLALLDGGICVDVFGESWEKASFARHENITCHPGVIFQESIGVMSASKISLNIMSWHKDGFTERILHAMLCRSVVLSDKSRYLTEVFEEGKELVLFDLEELEEVVQITKRLLEDDKRLAQIEEAGYRKANHRHLWNHRGKELLEIIESEKCNKICENGR